MKIIKEYWDDEGNQVNIEISEAEAIELLSFHYNKPDELVKIPCYYRLPYGGINVIEESKEV